MHRAPPPRHAGGGASPPLGFAPASEPVRAPLDPGPHGRGRGQGPELGQDLIDILLTRLGRHVPAPLLHQGRQLLLAADGVLACLGHEVRCGELHSVADRAKPAAHALRLLLTLVAMMASIAGLLPPCSSSGQPCKMPVSCWTRFSAAWA